MGDLLARDPKMLAFLLESKNYVNAQDFQGDGPAIQEFQGHIAAFGGKVTAKVIPVQLKNGPNQSVPINEKIACPTGYAPAEAELKSINYSATNGVVTTLKAVWDKICS